MLENIQPFLEIAIILILFTLSAMPLHRAVKFFKGKTKLRKTVLITFISGIMIGIITAIINISSNLLPLTILILIYKKSFRLTYWKSFLVLLLQIIFITIGSIIFKIIIQSISGISLFFN